MVEMRIGRWFTNLNEIGPTEGQPSSIVINLENPGVSVREDKTQAKGVQSDFHEKIITEENQPENREQQNSLKPVLIRTGSVRSSKHVT